MSEPDSKTKPVRSGTRCTVCNSEHRLAIEKALAVSRSGQSIATEFGLSKASINRHKAHIVQNLNDINEISRLKALAELDLKDKDPKIRHAARVELRSLFELETRIGQEASAQQSLTANPAWELIRTHLLNIINECDHCRKAVLEAMPPGDTRGE